MPWSNQGGNNGNGNQGGPWGNGPKRPNGGGGGQQPPDLDDIIKQGQDKIKQLFPGGGPGGGAGSNKFMALAIVVGLILIVGFNSFYRVQADEEGVVLRLGAFNRISNPGLRFAFWPIEKAEILQVTKEHNMTFGANGEGRMLAGDQNMVDIRFTVQWRIADPKKYLFNIRQPEALIRVIAESAMRDVVGRTAADIVRTKGRFDTQERVKTLIQKTLTSYDAGININGVQLEQADPPPEVVDAFEEVQRAEQEQNKLIREAERYRNKLLGEARGEAAQIVEKSKAYKAKVVAEAEGEAARFTKIYQQYAKAKDVTRKRLFLETMEQVLSKSNKVIIEGKGGNGVVPYLPLPEVGKQRQTGGN